MQSNSDNLAREILTDIVQDDSSYSDLSNDFDALWAVTNADSPSNINNTSTLDETISLQQATIYLLKDEVNIIREENMQLNQQLKLMADKIQQYDILMKDYSSLLELNKSLTKQLNKMFTLHEEEISKIKQIKNILNI